MISLVIYFHGTHLKITSNLYFYNYARKFEESIDLYNKGPFYKSLLLELASKLQGSIKVSVSVDVDLDIM